MIKQVSAGVVSDERKILMHSKKKKKGKWLTKKSVGVSAMLSCTKIVILFARHHGNTPPVHTPDPPFVSAPILFSLFKVWQMDPTPPSLHHPSQVESIQWSDYNEFAVPAASTHHHLAMSFHQLTTKPTHPSPDQSKSTEQASSRINSLLSFDTRNFHPCSRLC